MVGKYCSLSQEFFWNAHSVLREARKRGDWICISMNPCFLASNIFAFSCSSPCLPLSHGPLPLLPHPSIHLFSFSSACSCSYFFLAIQLIYIELYVSGVPWANGCLKFLPVVTSLSLAFVLPGSPPQGGIRRHSSSAGLSEYFTKPLTAS